MAVKYDTENRAVDQFFSLRDNGQLRRVIIDGCNFLNTIVTKYIFDFGIPEEK
jgi:hypothetical protein